MFKLTFMQSSVNDFISTLNNVRVILNSHCIDVAMIVATNMLCQIMTCANIVRVCALTLYFEYTSKGRLHLRDNALHLGDGLAQSGVTQL